MSRMAMFEADMPVTVPVYAVNRQCASGLQAIASIADSVHRFCHSLFPSPLPFPSLFSSPWSLILIFFKKSIILNSFKYIASSRSILSKFVAVLYCPILSYPILSSHVSSRLSHSHLTYFVLSYHIASYHILKRHYQLWHRCRSRKHDPQLLRSRHAGNSIFSAILLAVIWWLTYQYVKNNVIWLNNLKSS